MEQKDAGGLRSDQFSGLVLLLTALLIGWENRAYPLGSLQDPGPGYVPLMLAIFLGAIGLLIALRGMHGTPLRNISWPEAPRAVIILIVCGAAAYVLEKIGYRITVFLLLVFFLGVLERKKLWVILAVSLGFSLGSFYLFDTLLRVQLPVAPWGF